MIKEELNTIKRTLRLVSEDQKPTKKDKEDAKKLLKSFTTNKL